MEADEAVEHLSTIRRIMESATQLTVLPGKAAIVGGVLALGGCAATYWMMGSTSFGVMSTLSAGKRAALVAMWAGVAVVAVLVDVVMTVRIARKRGREPWSRLAQLAAYAIGPCVAAAVFISLALISRDAWDMIPAVWMMLYGAAVWMAGILSIHAPGVLGMAFFVVGAVTLFWGAALALVAVALTFGLGHIVFGIYLVKRFGD